VTGSGEGGVHLSSPWRGGGGKSLSACRKGNRVVGKEGGKGPVEPRGRRDSEKGFIRGEVSSREKKLAPSMGKSKRGRANCSAERKKKIFVDKRGRGKRYLGGEEKGCLTSYPRGGLGKNRNLFAKAERERSR